MKWFSMITLAMTMAAPAAFAQPQAGESYCVGVNPENCPYSWALDGRRWYFDGIPLGREDPQEERRESGEEAPRRPEEPGAYPTARPENRP